MQVSVGQCQQAFTSRPVPARCPRRHSSVRVRAEDQKGGLNFDPKLSKETGYLKEDSAGQENIYPVESKAFVGNKGGLGAGNAAFAGIAAGIAVAAIVGGIFLTKDKTTDVIPSSIRDEIPTQSLSSISKTLKETIKEAKDTANEAAESAKEAGEAIKDAAPSLN